MTVKFEYKCNNCSKDYVEQRGVTEPQFFVDCESCKQGQFIEVNQIVIADTIEVVTIPVQETPTEDTTTE
jgi:hypothetical protein